MELNIRQVSRIHPALISSAAIHRGEEPQSVTLFLNHPLISTSIVQDEDGLMPKYAASPFGRVARYRSRWETPTFASYCWTGHRIAGFTIENPYAMAGDLLLTREHYQEAGKLMASAVVETLSI